MGGLGGGGGQKYFCPSAFGGFVKVSLFWHLLTRKFHVKIQQGPSRIRQVRQVLTRRFLDEPIFIWCLTRNFLIQPLTRTFLVKENAHTLTRNCPCYAFNKGIPLLTYINKEFPCYGSTRKSLLKLIKESLFRLSLLRFLVTGLTRNVLVGISTRIPC